MEEQVTLEANDLRLEGRFSPGAAPFSALITHPHPLFGGSMDNNVVWTAVRAFGERGWSTLRFNFRGVGASSGSHGGGVAEVEDVVAAADFLKSRVSGPCFLVGYSFGAAVAARALLQGLDAAGGVLISPPIAFMDLDFLMDTPRLCLVVAGDRDDLCPLADVKNFCRRHQPPVDLRVVSGADHFYGGREKELFDILLEYPLPVES